MIVVGLVGVVVPVVPGLLLIWGGVAVWALSVQEVIGWTALSIATGVCPLRTISSGMTST